MTVESRMHHAQALLEDPLLNEILDNLREQAIAAWAATPALGGEAAREMAYYIVTGQDAVRTAIQAIVDNGRIAEAKLSAKPTA